VQLLAALYLKHKKLDAGAEQIKNSNTKRLEIYEAQIGPGPIRSGQP